MEDNQLNILLSDENIEVEAENNEFVTINVPFNPNDIKVRTQPLNLGDLIDMLQHDEVKLDTEFQRQLDLWSLTKKSRLIESVLLRLPIPTFYFDAQDDNKWRIIDGLQRISTLKSYVVEQSHSLVDLEFLKEFEGKKFNELPRDLQRRIKTFPITAYILEKGTPDIVKYNIFSRINQGGLVLKPQEMRHALHQGIAADIVADLVRGVDKLNEKGEVLKRIQPNKEEFLLSATTMGEAFVKATGGKIKTLRMEDRDFATRFISFYLIPYHNYEPDLNSFMNQGMAAIKKLSTIQLENLKFNFQKAMKLSFDIFGDDAFRKRFSESDSRRPINKALFETLSVSFAKLSNEDCINLVDRKSTFKSKFQDLHNSDGGKFVRAITQGTAQKDTVELRFSSIERIIRETLE